MRLETRRHRLRRELSEAGFRPEWREVVAERMAHWTLLDGGERDRLEALSLALMVDKRWEAAHGFEMSDEIMVTIAAQAALLQLGLADDAYRGVKTVIVHPTTLVLTGEHSQVPGLASDAPMPILGQAQYDGPVMIVWDAVLEAARHPERGHNVVYHEFAHKLDMLDGTVDGTPPLESREQLDRWVAVCTAVYEKVQRGAGSGAIGDYAGVNPAEFFAVATEAFFDNSVRLRRDEPDLYGVLVDFYRQDPAGRATRGGR